MAQQTDEELRRASLSLRYRALSGESLDNLLPEAFALVRQATERTRAQRHYDVQLLGGIAMHFGSIAEMQTGEGKTLAATLPLYLAALMDRGAHLATANDYLAERDASFTRDAFRLLGMTVGVIKSQTPREKRRDAYRCDITYAASREYGDLDRSGRSGSPSRHSKPRKRNSAVGTVARPPVLHMVKVG